MRRNSLDQPRLAIIKRAGWARHNKRPHGRSGTRFRALALSARAVLDSVGRRRNLCPVPESGGRSVAGIRNVAVAERAMAKQKPRRNRSYDGAGTEKRPMIDPIYRSEATQTVFWFT